MAKSKKYDCTVVQQDSQWTAQIVRRITSTKTLVSKSESGFATEAEALAWGQKELKGFLQTLDARNKRRSKPRTSGE